MNLFDLPPDDVQVGRWYRYNGTDVEVIMISGTRLWYRMAGFARTEQKVTELQHFQQHAREVMRG